MSTTFVFSKIDLTTQKNNKVGTVSGKQTGVVTSEGASLKIVNSLFVGTQNQDRSVRQCCFRVVTYHRVTNSCHDLRKLILI